MVGGGRVVMTYSIAKYKQKKNREDLKWRRQRASSDVNSKNFVSG
jgi:hypothetical protein